MRLTCMGILVAHAIAACGTQTDADVGHGAADVRSSAQAIVIDEAIQQAIVAGRSMARDADARHRALVAALN